jgi:phage protein D
MVQDRKEPTFSTAPKAAPNTNRSSARNTTNTSASSSEKTNVSPQASPNNASTNKAALRPRHDTRPQLMIQKQLSSLLWLTLFIAILASAASGYLFWQFNSAQQTIAEQQGRLAELENKLLLSDDESTQSLTVLSANVKSLDKNVTLAMTEVDKLWATRNANLEKLAAAKAEVEKSIDTTGEQSKKAIDDLNKQLKQSLSLLKQSTSEQDLLTKSLRERVSEQSQTLTNIQSTLKNSASSTEKLADITRNLTQLDQKVTTLTRRTQEYDEAIESFDKFRLLTNRDLINLKNRAGIAPQ